MALLPVVFRVVTAITHPGVDDYAEFFPVFRSPFHVTFDGLAIGVLAAFVYRDRQQLAWTKRPGTVNRLFWIGAVPYGLLAAGWPLLDSIDLFDKLVLQAALAWTAGTMLLALALGGGPRRFFSQSWMFIVSKLSYTWYLLHLMFVPWSLRITESLVGNPATLGRGLRWALFTPIYITLSLTAALVLHYAIEKPFIHLRDRRRKERHAELDAVARPDAEVH